MSIYERLGETRGICAAVGDVTPGAFHRVDGHLVATLADLGVQDRDLATVGQALTADRDNADRDNIVTAEYPAA